MDQDGAELGRIGLNTQELLEKQIDAVLVDDSNWTYIVSGNSVMVLNQSQRLQFTLEAGGNTAPRPVRLSNGQAVF